MSIGRVLMDIASERDRQEAKCAAKRAEGFPWRSLADPLCTNERRIATLGEEFGEVCREISDAGGDGRPPGPNLRVELIQVAALAVAWVEHLDAGAAQRDPDLHADAEWDDLMAGLG